MQIDKVTAIDSEKQLVNVTITKGDDSYKYQMNTHVLEGDALQAHCDAEEYRHLNNILYQLYDRKIKFEKEDEWDEWGAAGRKIPEVKQEIPSVKAKAAVYEDVEVEPAVEAKDAVMGERQKESSKEVDKSEVQVVKEGGKYVQKTVVSKEVVKEKVYEEVSLYDEDAEEIGKHSIPVMEEYEEEPAVKAKAAVTERRLVSEAVKAVAKKELIIKPEAVIEKKAWVNSH